MTKAHVKSRWTKNSEDLDFFIFLNEFTIHMIYAKNLEFSLVSIAMLNARVKLRKSTQLKFLSLH